MKIICAIGVLIFICASVSAQTLERGDNEFGFWGGFSPKATTIFEGLSEAEAEDREFFLAAFRYGRTLAANDTLALQWTVDAVPVAVATGTIVSRSFAGGTQTFQRETAYGAGITPIGLQLDFANGSKVHPFALGMVGFFISTSRCRLKTLVSFNLSVKLVGEFGYLLPINARSVLA